MNPSVAYRLLISEPNPILVTDLQSVQLRLTWNKMETTEIGGIIETLTQSELQEVAVLIQIVGYSLD